ncbi:LLM class flavin-dependent oxidoreductase [Kitasatospora sp. NPDC093806]|uniref:LLM class flavin-dependent oxidoreductase n=1 Tax=Kitasatospora sp. NPDC093806 TaxID=3155075 RepID=UPI0034476B63
MKVGIGLPTSLAGATGAEVLGWARLAEETGFSTLGTIDRLVHTSWEPLGTLAAAAAVTGRIGLATSVLISPLRSDTALLAKQAATVDRLSGGRLTLGLAVGSRPDDFEVGRVAKAGRGARTGTRVAELRRHWADAQSGREPAVGPAPVRPNGPELILGGHSPAALRRAALLGDGWIGGGTGPVLFAQGAQAVRERWAAEGRVGTPRLLALAYFALGEDAAKRTEGYLRAYYRDAGPFVEHILRGAADHPGKLRGLAGAYAEAGCDELLLMPCAGDLGQVTAAAEALALQG